MLSKDQLSELETKYGRVAHVLGKWPNGTPPGGTVEPPWECVFRKPNRAEYKRFRSMISNDSQRSDATEHLARACVVFPTREAFDALLEDWVSAADACGNALGEIAGLASEQAVKE
jgi:hypothetical protein